MTRERRLLRINFPFSFQGIFGQYDSDSLLNAAGHSYRIGCFLQVDRIPISRIACFHRITIQRLDLLHAQVEVESAFVRYEIKEHYEVMGSRENYGLPYQQRFEAAL